MSSTVTADFGLGTAYERHALYQRLEGWLGVPETFLEGPIDGFAGMAGLHGLRAAFSGTQVTVVLPSARALEQVRRVYGRAGLDDRLTTILGDRLPEGTWEVVLGFNALPLAKDWRALTRELLGRAGRLAVIAVTHPFSYGVMLRRLLRRFEPKRELELFDHEATRAHVLEPVLSRYGRIVDRAWVDCPWWPDLFVTAGTGLWDATLTRLTSRPVAPAANNFRYTAEDFPWALGVTPPEVLRALRRHPTFDQLQALGTVFAHHRAYLVEPTRDKG